MQRLSSRSRSLFRQIIRLSGVMFSILFTLLLLGTWTVKAQVETLLDLWEQVVAQPQDFSVGCMPLYHENDAVFFNADERFPLASISKLLIFIEYARRVEAGSIPMDETVSVSTLDRYNLPRTDRGAHDRFMETYPVGTQVILLWDVAVGMIQYSSNAASDYLLDRLAPTDWPALYQTLAITQTDPPHSLTLIPLLMNNHETGKATMADLSLLSTLQGETYLDLYVNDPQWREAEVVYRSPRESQFPDWETQAAILQQYTATGTVRDFMNVLTAIYGADNRLSDEVKTMVRTALQWDENDFINDRYVEYGSKLGFYSGGTLTLIAYGYPRGGGPVISATFFRNIPRRMYSELVREDAIGDFAHWLNFNECDGLPQSLP